MRPVAVITDTDSSLPLELAKEYGIAQVPITIQFGEESYQAVYEIDDAATFTRVDREGRIPTTSAPSPGQFVRAYQAAFDGGAEAILVFTISSEMSAIYTSARTAAETFPGKEIVIVDSRTASIGQGFMAITAVEALRQGATIDEAVAAAKSVGERTHLFGALATLKYLAMSGRVGQVAAGLGNLLEVKPVLTICNGKLDLLERVRTQSKAWGRAIELAVEAAGGKKIERLAIVHVNALEAAKRFETQVRAALDCPAETLYIDMTPGLSIHTGTGWVGVVFTTA